MIWRVFLKYLTFRWKEESIFHHFGVNISFTKNLFFLWRFLLPYERHTKGLGENQVKRRESESNSSEKVCIFLFLTQTLRPGSCTSELQLKVNCRPKKNCRKKFGLACRPTVGRQTRPNYFLQLTFNIQFTFSCNSLVHDPALILSSSV